MSAILHAVRTRLLVREQKRDAQRADGPPVAVVGVAPRTPSAVRREELRSALRTSSRKSQFADSDDEEEETGDNFTAGERWVVGMRKTKAALVWRDAAGRGALNDVRMYQPDRGSNALAFCR